MSETREKLRIVLDLWVRDVTSSAEEPINQFQRLLTAQGLAIVPLEPTKEMTDAGCDSVSRPVHCDPDGTITITAAAVNGSEADKIYKAMLNAAIDDAIDKLPKLGMD